MTSLQAALLGLLQGLTEFLPVSSSGHLLLAETLLKIEVGGGLLFDVLVHAGTLGAILVVFRADVVLMLRGALGVLLHPVAGPRRWMSHPPERLIILLFLGSLPTLAVVLALELTPSGDGDLMAAVEGLLRAPANVPLVCGLGLLGTAGLLGLTLRQPGRERTLGVRLALIVGTMQAVALLPGVSRSGSTISIALLLGLARPEAARFSFLLAIPAIGGAFLYEGLGLLEEGAATGDLAPYLVGFTVAFVAGLASLKLLLGMVRRGRLAWFAPYCGLVGLLALAWWFTGQ